jgi:hypothetical protein
MKKLASRLAPFVMAVSALSALAQETPGGAFIDPRLPKEEQDRQRLAQQQAAAAKPAPTPGAATDVVTFGRLSIASLDAVNKLLADLEAPNSDPLRRSIEQAPFLGEGSLAMDKPLGIFLIATPNAPLYSSQNLVTAMPVKDGKATAEDLTKAGGKTVEGTTDMLRMADGTVRRTAHYLFAREGEGTTGLAGFSDTPFGADYRTPTNLMVAVLDLAKLRAGAPNAYKQLTAVGSWLPVPPDSDAPKVFQEMVDKIDRLTLAFARDDKNMHLQLWKLPFATKAGKAMPRPAFPAGMIAQMHVVYPDAETAAWLDQQLDQMQDASIPGPPEKRPQVKAVLKRLAKFNGQAEAVSMAVTMQDKMPLVYVVDQLREEVNVGEELKGLATDLKAIAGEELAKADVTTYDAGGKTVQRLELSGKGPEQHVYIDALQQGKVVYFAFSGKEDKVVESLAGAGMNGSSNVLCAGVVDLSAALNAASSGGGGPLSQLPPDALAQLKTAFAGQGITWTAQGGEGAANYLYFDLTVPFQAAKQVGHLIRTMNGQ